MFHIPIARRRLVFKGIHSLRDALHDLFAVLLAGLIMGAGSIAAITLTGSWKFIVINQWRKTIRDVNVVVIGLHPRHLFGSGGFASTIDALELYLHHLMGRLMPRRGISEVDQHSGRFIYSWILYDSGRDWRGGRIGVAYADSRQAPKHLIAPISLHLHQSRRRPFAGIAMTA